MSSKVIHIKKEGPPQVGPPPSKGVNVHEFIPNVPSFRKTAEQVAAGYLPLLEELGIIATLEEVVDVIRGNAAPSILTTIVEGWVDDEKKRGISIF